MNWNHIGFKLRNDPSEPFGVMAASQLWEGSSPHFVERIPWTSELRTTICKQMGRKEKKGNVWQCHFFWAQQGDGFKLLLNENWRFQHVWIFTLVPVSQVSFNFNIFNHGVTAAMVRRSSRSVAQHGAAIFEVLGASDPWKHWKLYPKSHKRSADRTRCRMPDTS